MEIIDTSSVVETDELHDEKNKPLLSSEEYSKIKILVCTPCFGGKIDQATVSGMFGATSLGLNLGIEIDFRFLSNDSLITRARNNLVAQFLASDHTHLFFLDADIQFNPHSLFRLALADRMVTVGAYPTKSMPPRYVIDFKEGEECDDLNFIEVLHAGTGFMCIKRECLEQMKEAHPELKYRSELEIGGYSSDAVAALGEEAVEKIKDNTYRFFDTSVHETSHTYLSEDYTFCERWNKLGGKIWLDAGSKIDHVGAITFALSVDDFDSEFEGKNKRFETQEDNDNE